MEPLRIVSPHNEGFKASTFLGILVFVLCFAVPASSALLLLLFSEKAAFTLSTAFWLLVAKSCFWGLSLSAASAALSILFAFFPALYLAFRGKPLPTFVFSLLRGLGFMIFALPSAALALGILSLIPSSWPPFLAQGFLPVLVAHVFWNIIFLTSVFCEKLQTWKSAEGSSILEQAQSLGARSPLLVSRFIFPLLLPELKFWAGAIFLWSLYSFGTVLILGGGPGASTPEVLLFYHLFSLYDPSRLLVLLPVTMLINTVVFKVLREKMHAGPAKTGRAFDHKPRVARGFFSSLAPTLIFPALALVLFILLVSKTLSGLALPETTDAFSSSFLHLGHSLILSGLSVLFASILLFASIVSQPSLRRILAYGISFSPSILALAYTQNLSSILWRIPLSMRIILTAFLTALVQWPLLDLWVQLRLRQLSPSIFEEARSLGASLRQRILWLRFPALKDVFVQALAVVFLGSFGDLLFAALFLEDWKTLPIWAEEKAAQYVFFPSKFFLLATWLCLLLVPALSLLKRRSLRHA